ncbi:hypothetical protein [Sinomonas gamaensis]|uniref:hypothetical protein n=1 Tax=Sinomonas gamaensis TaxID=2565624 RepID=UPI0011091259|nr:hypothetical protein [Sinomonas gamaensis]
MLVSALACLSLTACQQEIVGQILSDFESTVTKILDTATADADDVLSTAAGQAFLYAKDFESQFAADLEKTINNVDQTVRGALVRIEQMEKNFARDAKELNQQATDNLQQLLNSFNWTNKNPQVTRYWPQSTALKLEDNKPVEFHVHGNWPYAFDTGTLPTLKVGNKTIRPEAAWSTNEVVFDLPPDQLNLQPDRISRVHMDLEVQYDQNQKLGTVKLGHFRLEMHVLPYIPLLELTLKNTSKIDGPVSSTFNLPDGHDSTGLDYRVESWSTCKDQSLRPDGKPVKHPPKDPEAIITAADIVPDHYGFAARSKWEVSYIEPKEVAFNAWSYANCPLGVSVNSGDFSFHVTVHQSKRVQIVENQYCDLLHHVALPAARKGDGGDTGGPVIDPTPNPSKPTSDCSQENLTWGSTITIPVTHGGWILHSKLWDGTNVDFSADNITRNPYIQVEDQGDKIDITLNPAYATSQ